MADTELVTLTIGTSLTRTITTTRVIMTVSTEVTAGTITLDIEAHVLTRMKGAEGGAVTDIKIAAVIKTAARTTAV